MALTLTIDGQINHTPRGDEKASGKALTEIFGTIAWDASYLTGGEILNTLLANYMNAVLHVDLYPFSGYMAQYIPSTGAAMLYYVDNNAAGDSAQIEVPSVTDVSAITAMRFRAVGSQKA